MSILAQVALVCALVGAPGARTTAPAPTAAAAPPAAGAADASADEALRAIQAEVEALQKAAGEAEAVAPDEAARLRARVNLVAQLLLVVIRQQEQLRQQNQALLAALARSGSPAGPAAGAPSGFSAAPGKAQPGAARPAAGASTAPARPPSHSGPYYAKRGGSGKVHRPGCMAGERIAAAERVSFATLAQAVAAGFQPCKMCRPER